METENKRYSNYNACRPIYEKLFADVWNGKPIWEHIRDKELTCAPAFKGTEYDSQSIKIMLVGRAVNGWEVEFKDCETIEKTLDSVLYQDNRMDDFAGEPLEYEKKDKQGNIVKAKYFYTKSPFLRLMKKLIRALVDKDGCEEAGWQQRLVWSNLYKISYRNGGNPSWKMIKEKTQEYRALLENEIKEYSPNIVVFVVGKSWFKCFFDMLDNNSKVVEGKEYIRAAGRLKSNNEVKVVVCDRPERRPTDMLVKEILEVNGEI